MKFTNNGAALKIIWNGGDYEIPTGEFKVENEALGSFIVKKANQWKLNITETRTVVVAPKIEPIVAKEEPVATVSAEIEEQKQESKEDAKEEKKTKIKKSKELENSL